MLSAGADTGVKVGSREGVRLLNIALLKAIGHFADEREFGDSISDHSAEALAEVDAIIASLIPADAAEPDDVRDAIVHFGDWVAKRFLNREWRRITALADWLEDRQVTLSGDDAKAIYEAA